MTTRIPFDGANLRRRLPAGQGDGPALNGFLFRAGFPFWPVFLPGQC